jgi:hypothetical protein
MRRKLWHPCRGAVAGRRFPVVSLADSLNHRLFRWQASGLHKRKGFAQRFPLRLLETVVNQDADRLPREWLTGPERR